MVREKIQKTAPPTHVYDIYYMNSAGFDLRAFENVCAIEAFREDDLTQEESEEAMRVADDDEDEDSNDEGNYRNDYPDGDPDGDSDGDGFCYGEGDPCTMNNGKPQFHIRRISTNAHNTMNHCVMDIC